MQTALTSQILKVSLFQSENSPDIDKNCEHAINALKCAKLNGVGLVVFPECYLTGFGPHLLTTPYTQVESALSLIQEAVNNLGVSAVLPSAIKDTATSAAYNCCIVLRPGTKPLTFYKEGLTESEKTLFSAKQNRSRSFEIGSFHFQILVCKEISDPPWKHLSNENMPDIILWPAYWGWEFDSTWPSSKGQALCAGENAKLWKRPIFHVNYSKNWQGDPRESGPTGKSMMISDTNKILKIGLYGKNDLITGTVERSPKGIVRLL